MSLIAITGAGSGIGAATAAALQAAGHRILGVDIRNAEIVADLSTTDGRAQAVAALLDRSAGVLDGLVLCAGIGPQVEPASKIAAVNYFGVVSLLDGLLDALARGHAPSAVVVSSVARDWRAALDAALARAIRSVVRRIKRAAPARTPRAASPVPQALY